MFADLAQVVHGFQQPERPTLSETGALLHNAFLQLEAVVATGIREKHAKRDLRTWLRRNCDWLPHDPHSLKRRLNRDLAYWRAHGRNREALSDGRGAANRARRKEPPEVLVNRLAYEVLHQHRPLAAAWREVQKEDGVIRTPRPPHFVRRVVSPLVERLRLWHDSPRKAGINGAYNLLDWSSVYAGDIFSADDFTLEIYFYRSDGTLTRGQFLMMMDARSKMILAGILIPRKSYSAVDIRQLVLKCADEYGLPRRHFLFENGIWKRSKLIGGDVPTGQGTRENFAQRLGIEIRHATPGNPRGKAFLERSGREFQARLRHLPGWVGPNEQLSAIESVQRAKQDVVNGRKTAPDAGFMSFEYYLHQIEREIDAYNNTPSRSRVMGGDREVTMTPKQAWQELQLRNVAGDVVQGVSLRGDLRYLLASHVELRKVTPNGILIGREYCFREGLADFVGMDILTYWDIEQPEYLTCETEAGRIFTVTREPMVSAVAGREELAAAQRRKNQFNQQLKGQLAEIMTVAVGKPRQVVATPGDLAKACEVRKQREDCSRVAREQKHLEKRLGYRVSPELVEDPDVQSVSRLVAKFKHQGVS